MSPFSGHNHSHVFLSSMMAYLNISCLFYFWSRQTASQRQSQPRPQPVLSKSMPRPPVAARRPVPLPRALSATSGVATSGATTLGASTSGTAASGVRKSFLFVFCFVLFCLFCYVEISTLSDDLY